MSSEEGEVASDVVREDVRTGIGSRSWVPGGNSKAIPGEEWSAWSGLGWWDGMTESNEHSLFHHPRASRLYMMEMLIAVCLLPFIPEVNKKCDKANSILLPMLLCEF